MKAFDFDGVTSKGFWDGKSPIITGRHYSASHSTVMWFIKNGHDVPPIYFNPKRLNLDYGNQESKIANRVDAGIWKAHMINWLGVTEFWEDIKLQADIIKAKCPHCKVMFCHNEIGKVIEL